MHWSKPWRLLASVIITAVLLGAAPPAVAAPPPVAEQVATVVREQLHASRVPAASYAVLTSGQVTTGAVGAGIGGDTPFVLGSLSKSFTALATLQLVDAGRVDLDTPVTRYLPGFSTATPTGITVRQLLTQTSGLPTSAGLGIIDHPDDSLVDRVAGAAQVYPASAPGTAFEYSNLNYAVLGRVVEETSGQPFQTYVQRRIFDPLGMRGSHTSVAAARAAGLAPASTVWFGISAARSTPDYPGGTPDGFLVSTANDMAAYLSFQLGDGTWDGARVVSEESMRLMHTPAVATPPGAAAAGTEAYAMGWGVGRLGPAPLLAHDGDTIGYHAEMALLPASGAGLVLLSARNGALTGARAPFAAGLTVLAGEPPPPVDRSFTLTYLLLDAVGALVLTVLVAWMLHPRWRERILERSARRGPARGVVLPALGYLLLAAGTYAAVFWGLGLLTVGSPMSLRFAFGFVAPDLTVLVLVVCATFLLRAVLTAGLAVRARSGKPHLPSTEAAAHRTSDHQGP